MHNNNNNIYQPNTTLQLLEPSSHHWRSDTMALRYEDFGPLRAVYKPHWLATTAWSQHSLLDELITNYPYHPLIHQANTVFWVHEELGMLTRLDNDTAGLVWFARDRDVKQQWLHDQAQWQIHKIYEADVMWWVKAPESITTPIMHHRYDHSKMIIATTHTKGRGSVHEVTTEIHPMEIKGNNTHLQAIIHQWCRHQIRIHCASHGNPILGETLYHKHKQHHDTFLHLRSVGIDWKYLDHPIIVDYVWFDKHIFDHYN